MTSLECQGDNQDLESSSSREEGVQKSKLQTCPDGFIYSAIASTNSLPSSWWQGLPPFYSPLYDSYLHSMVLDHKIPFFNFSSPSVSVLHLQIFLVLCVSMITNPVIATLDSLCHLPLPSISLFRPSIHSQISWRKLWNAYSIFNPTIALTFCLFIHSKIIFEPLFRAIYYGRGTNVIQYSK